VSEKKTELTGLRAAAKSVLFFRDKVLAFSANGAAVVGDKIFRLAFVERKRWRTSKRGG
jgi:hypothetical protein